MRLLSHAGLAEAVREHLLMAKLAGAAIWLAWIVSLALGGWTHDSTGHPTGADHVQYYVVGRLVAEGHGEMIYDEPTMTALQKDVAGPHWKGVLPFRYPPFYALCFAATSQMPYIASWLVWALLSLLALVVAAAALGVDDLKNWLLWSLCFYPVFAAISFRANSLFSLAFLAATFAACSSQGHGFWRLAWSRVCCCSSRNFWSASVCSGRWTCAAPGGRCSE